MIEKNEILTTSKALGLNPDTVEKDYVLGWLLQGINQHPVINTWAFKGGTSLKKCFFETFRFSEDLDYTLVDNDQLNIEFLKKTFAEIIESLSEHVGIDFFPGELKFKIIDKANGSFSAQGKIPYNGPLRRTRGVATIKLDLTTDEVLVLETVVKRVHHPYSDEPENGIHAKCYAFEEVVAEKIRALAQRIRPRDLYDVIHFFRNRSMIENPRLVLSVLDKKCQFKNIGMPTFQGIEQHEKLDELEPQWEHMLAHQLSALPPMETFWQDLEPFFDWLEGHLQVNELAQSSRVTGQVFQAGRFSGRGDTPAILQKIQFGAANRVCIKLVYSGKERVVEPLSFRTSEGTGNKLFYGYEREAGHVKAYTISKIENVSVTNIPYTEKYPVEISPSGYISMPPLRRASTGGISANRVPRSRRSANSAFGTVYKIQCPICQKTFGRKNYSDTIINKHKSPWGSQCSGSGRRGYHI